MPPHHKDRPAPKPGILDIKPYVPGKSRASERLRGTQLVRHSLGEGGSEPHKIIKLSANENALGASPKAVEAYRRTAAALHRYPDGSQAALREAIAEVHGLEAGAVVCGAGSDELIGLLIRAYAGAGDEVLYSEHGFLMYRIYALGHGATPVAAPEKDLRGDVGAILKAATPRTKIVFIANPNNPTGSYLTREELTRLRDGLAPQVILAIDAAYAEYVEAEDYGDGLEMVRSGGNTVMLRTFSKIHGLAALRLGWMVAPPPVVDVMHRIRGPFNVNAPALAAGIAAVRDRDHVERSRSHNREERAQLAVEIAALGLKVWPSAGNFLLVEFPPDGVRTAQAANAHLSSRGVIPREVGEYGLTRHLRITVGTEPENRALMEALGEFIGKA